MSVSTLKEWNILERLSVNDLEDIAFLNIYGGERFSEQGLSALYISKSDRNVYFLGYNSLVGWHCSSPAPARDDGKTYRITWKEKLDELSRLLLTKIVVASAFGMGLSENGDLYYWGDQPGRFGAYNKYNTVMYACYEGTESCHYCWGHYTSYSATRVNECKNDLKIRCNRGNCIENLSYTESPPPHDTPYRLFVRFDKLVVPCSKCGENCTPNELGGIEVNYCKPCDWYHEVGAEKIEIGPRRTKLAKGLTVSELDCGDDFVAVLTVSNQISFWGKIGSFIYRGFLEIPGKVTIQRIVCGHSHLAAISDDGQLFTCGLGDSGQLGYPWNESMGYTCLRKVHIEGTVEKVCCGKTATVCLTSDGSLFCFGGNMRMTSSGLKMVTGSGYISSPFRLLEKQKFHDLQNARLLNFFAAETLESTVYTWGVIGSTVRFPEIDCEVHNCFEALVNHPVIYPIPEKVAFNQNQIADPAKTENSIKESLLTCLKHLDI